MQAPYGPHSWRARCAVAVDAKCEQVGDGQDAGGPSKGNLFTKLGITSRVELARLDLGNT